ncbi:MAG: GNAT family N-acyltransferase [Pseudomonadota bacterium]
MTTSSTSEFSISLAETEADLRAAQRLRYQVFVEELGGGGALVDHDAKIEQDRFDPYFDHLLLRANPSGKIVGVYRIMRRDQAVRAGQFYSAEEYDLGPLLNCGRPLLELGRSCLHRDYRGGMALYHLWNGLARYIFEHNIEILFGVASFHGTDVQKLSQALSLLHHRHMAPRNLRPRVHEEYFQSMDLVPDAQIDRVAAMKKVPSLIKSYLRLGGFVGEGAYIDHDFNTTDVCLILDTAAMNDVQAKYYRRTAR